VNYCLDGGDMQWCHYFELIAMAISMSICHCLAISE